MKIRPLLLFAAGFFISIGPFLGAAEEKKAPEPSTYDKKAYQFEHRLLPNWTHKSKGEFFVDLSKGALDRLTEAATELVGKEFAQKMTVRVLPGGAQILITFQPPTEMPLCFFALIQKSGDTYRYFTLELTLDLVGDGTKAVLGEWNDQGGHLNLGPRKYSDAESFIADAAAAAQKKN